MVRLPSCEGRVQAGGFSPWGGSKDVAFTYSCSTRNSNLRLSLLRKI